MSREKYSCYEFLIKESNQGEWIYEIYTSDIDHKNWLKTDVLRESEEWYETEQQARFAAIGHIDLLENGEG